jgi:hypothetical protein
MTYQVIPVRRRTSNKTNKYKNIPTTYNGRTYDSKLEADFAWDCDQRKKTGEILTWEAQVSMPLEVNGVVVCKYIIDFLVILPNGHRRYIETKGRETDVWRLKAKLLRAIMKGQKDCSYRVLVMF